VNDALEKPAALVAAQDRNNLLWKSWLIARFQRFITEFLIEKQLGQRRPELTDELYQAWREIDQRGLKETPEYRNVMKRAHRHAFWLAGLAMLSNPDAAPPLPSKETEPC